MTPASFSFLAVTSAMCSSGIDTLSRTSGATLCIVFVQITMKSAPARSRRLAASTRISALRFQSPDDWQLSISSKSTLYINNFAEWRPLSSSLIVSLMT